MKAAASLLLLVCDLVAWNLAYGDRLEERDGYVEEGPANADLDRLRSLREYVYGGAAGGTRRTASEQLENWTGRWMPERPADPTPPSKVFPKSDEFVHRVPMGRPSPDCDDGNTNTTLDWNRSPINHTCYGNRIPPNEEAIPIVYCERIPLNYVATHKCMNQRIDYDDPVPLFGPHRPLWPVYGEYEFLPRQRWIHSLEHGAIALLYHPCANPLEIERLKSLVSGCLRRHVITPYNLLDEDRPLALVAWGCRLTMSRVTPDIVIRFVREHALRGPEEISRDGDFDDGLLSRAEVVSDPDDTNLCPNVRA